MGTDFALHFVVNTETVLMIWAGYKFAYTNEHHVGNKSMPQVNCCSIWQLASFFYFYCFTLRIYCFTASAQLIIQTTDTFTFFLRSFEVVSMILIERIQKITLNFFSCDSKVTLFCSYQC